MAKILVRKSEDGKHYFVVQANNNKIVAVSETYESKQGCMEGIKSLTEILTSPDLEIEETYDKRRS